MYGRIRAFGTTTLLVVVAMGCGFDAEEVRRPRSDDATPSRRVLSAEEDIARRSITVVVFADAPGKDNHRVNGEYVTLANSSSAALEIGGWSLCDSPSPCFTFPPGTSIPANGSVRLYSGSGAATATSFYMGSGRAVWDNEHDIATLLHGETVIAQDIY